MEELEQKSFFTGYQLRLGDAQLLYKVSRRGVHQEYAINYEYLGGTRTSHLKGRPLLWISGVLLLLLSFVYLILHLSQGISGSSIWDRIFVILLPGLGLLLVLLFFWGRRSLWRVSTLDKWPTIWFYKSRPSRFVVDGFYEKLLDARNSYLYKQYATLEDGLSYEEYLSNLKWLRSIQALDEQQYDLLYEQLKKRTDPGSTRIGFGH